MTNSHSGNASFRWTITLFRSLQAYGVQDLVLSPGSRSTPLTLAAASNEYLQKHVILDERSAAFTALGIGKATNIPAVLVCTSGTALANYYPAVIEARQSGIPMILATADRPPNLRATGANQAIDQLKMFGDYPVFFHEVGEPKLEDDDLNRLRLLGQQSVQTARQKRGAVHLNFAFRKPLEPESIEVTNIASNFSDSVEQQESMSTSIRLPGSLTNHLNEAEKPLIIAGPLAPHDDTKSIKQLATQLNCPILTESTIATEYTISGFSGFLRNKKLRNQLEPDLILRFGFQPTAKSLQLALEQWNPNHHYHFASTDQWQDATYSGAHRIEWMGKPVSYSNITSSAKTDWLDSWQQPAKKFDHHRSQLISKQDILTDGAIYDQLTPQISNNYFIAVANSFPARDIQLFGRQSSDVPLYLNRGASGIDGVTSTALGLSLALQQPGVLFTGDLAFLHDTNALLNQKKIEHPLIIMVINNAGGSIFRMLPIAEHDEYFEPYFETPQSANISALVKSYGIPYQKIETLNKLRKVDISDWMDKHSGLSVIECVTDAEASMELRQNLWDF